MAIKLHNSIEYEYIMMFPGMCGFLRRLEPYTITTTSNRPPLLRESESALKIGLGDVLLVAILDVSVR